MSGDIGYQGCAAAPNTFGVETVEVPSGKHLHNHHNYGKSPCLMGKLTINDYKWSFSIAMLNYQRVSTMMLPSSKLQSNNLIVQQKNTPVSINDWDWTIFCNRHLARNT
jgi:hypothetical protein